MIDAQTIYSLIRNKFKRMGYSVFPQVRNNQGHANIRIADALAISQSALRDTSFIGFEIKISTADFRNELANPPKADAIAQYCNKWYVVAPKGVIPISELPDKWGLLEATKSKLKMAKEASDLPCVQPTREFVAMIVRKAEGGVALKSEYWRGYQEGKKQDRERKDDTAQQTYEDLQKMREAVKTFEAHSGISFYFWKDEARRIGEAVKLIKEGSIIYRVEGVEKTLEELLEQIKKAKQELESNPLGVREFEV